LNDILEEFKFLRLVPSTAAKFLSFDATVFDIGCWKRSFGILGLSLPVSEVSSSFWLGSTKEFS
jgi:hypothetical protein